LSFENNTHKFAKQYLDVPSLTVKIFCGQIKLKLSWLEKNNNTVGRKKGTAQQWRGQDGFMLLLCIRV